MRLDVSSADDCYVLPGPRQFVSMKQKCCNCYRAAGLRYSFGVCRQPKHGFTDFVLSNAHNVVHVTKHVLEINGADTLSTQAVSHSSSHFVGGEMNDLSGSQASLCVGCQRRFRSNDLY